MNDTCICENTPRVWRLTGVTRTLRLRIFNPDGTPLDLSGREAAVTIARDNSEFSYAPGFVVEGDDNNVVKFEWPADKQGAGDYTITLTTTDGSGNADRVNWHGPTGIRLVDFSFMVRGEDALGVTSEATIGLNGTYTMNGTGMSAYDEWLAEGHTGSEADFVAWMQQPAQEAKQELEAELGSRDGSTAGDGTMWGDYKSAEAQRGHDYEEAETSRNTRYGTAEGTNASDAAGTSRWSAYKRAEAARDAARLTAEGTDESTAGDGSRWGAYKAAEAARQSAFTGSQTSRQNAYTAAEGSNASTAGDGSRWGAYKSAEASRTSAFNNAQTSRTNSYNAAEGTSDSAAGENSRWGAYKTAEAARNAARLAAEGTSESTAGDGTRWGAYKTAEAARDTARANAEGTASSTAGDGTRWGAYKQAEAQRQNAYNTAEGSASSVAGDGSRWGAYKAAEAERSEQMNALQATVNGLADGTTVPKLAENLKSWEERNALNVDDEWAENIRTTAGDQSIDSSRGARLISIVAQTDFAATAFKETGFNLLHDAVAVGDGYYFPVPALAFGTFGTATQPNGVLFTNSSRENLKPTVRFKALADGVPTSLNDGDACAYTDSNGYRFYTTPSAGYLIVSGITLASTCAHIGWSRRYDDYVAPDASADAGSTIALSAILTAVHSDVSKLLAVGSGASLVSDRIDFGASIATWTRKVQRVKPTWTRSDLDPETGLYTYTAAIASMVSGGLAEFETGNVAIEVNGTNISYQSESSTATNDYVKYQLATQATGSVALSNTLALEDWGLEILVGASGSAIITAQYAQGYPDALAQLLANIDQSTVPIICAAFAKMQGEIDGLKAALYEGINLLRVAAMRVDTAELYRCGVPAELYCDTAGAPAAARVPKNWNTDTMGLWTGVPRFVGQIYADRVSKKIYVAWTVNNSTNDWVILN